MLNWVEPPKSKKNNTVMNKSIDDDIIEDDADEDNRSVRTDITSESNSDTEEYEKVRRFFIIKAFKGHCLCS